MIFVIMGVSGCGKTTIGTELAKRLGWPFADADDYHSDANKSKMINGQPLNDEDRLPWLLSLHQQIDEWSANEENAVITCSSLKRFYRCVLLLGLTENPHKEETDAGKEDDFTRNAFQMPTNFIDSCLASELLVMHKCCHGIKHSVLFIFLSTSEEVLTQRLSKRIGHFMPPSLLRSQLEALEEPKYPEKFVKLDGDKSVSEIIEDCLAKAVEQYDSLTNN